MNYRDCYLCNTPITDRQNWHHDYEGMRHFSCEVEARRMMQEMGTHHPEDVKKKLTKYKQFYEGIQPPKKKAPSSFLKESIPQVVATF